MTSRTHQEETEAEKAIRRDERHKLADLLEHHAPPILEFVKDKQGALDLIVMLLRLDQTPTEGQRSMTERKPAPTFHVYTDPELWPDDWGPNCNTCGDALEDHTMEALIKCFRASGNAVRACDECRAERNK